MGSYEPCRNEDGSRSGLSPATRIERPGLPTRWSLPISPSLRLWVRRLPESMASSPTPIPSRHRTPTRSPRALQLPRPPKRPESSTTSGSTLPNVEVLSGGRYHVPHFTNKATVNDAVEDAGFARCTFVEPPFYYQNLDSPMYPTAPGPDGTPTWSVPMRWDARGIHMGDITEFGNLVAGVFERPESVGDGRRLSFAGDLVSWDDIVATLNSQGHDLAYIQGTDDPWGIRDMFAYFEDHTYFGPGAEPRIDAARSATTTPFTDFATWAKSNMAGS